MDISDNIKKIRELRNFTQDHMANELRMTQAGYSKIETGNTDVTYSKLIEIAEVLNVSVQDLVTFDSQKYFNSFNNVKGNNNGGVIIGSNSDELKKLYEDKIILLSKLLQKTESELIRFKNKFGDI